MKNKISKNGKIPLKQSKPQKKIDISQIESELEKEKKAYKDFISKGNYSQAEICNNKIENLKKLIKQEKEKELSRRHFTEKEILIQDKISDIDNLNSLWDRRFEEVQLKSKIAIEELRKMQKEELQKLLLEYQQSTIKLIPSARYLELKKEEEGLVRLKKFKEAAIIKKKKENQIKIDEAKIEKNNEIKFKNYEKKLKQKHIIELQYLQNKFQVELDELLKEKIKDMEFLDKKYSVKCKDLINQQKREGNIRKYNKYGNRIYQLDKNYEIKYNVIKSEKIESEEDNKKEKINAELSDKNIYKEEEVVKEDENNKNIEKIIIDKKDIINDKSKEEEEEEEEENDEVI